MSPDLDLERLLRDARGALPEPAADTTVRARGGALAVVAARRPSRRGRVAAASVVVAVAVLAVGSGIGALLAPSSQAAKGPIGLGFLPAPGWLAFQTGGETSPIFQTVAVAANVPLDPADQVAGVAQASGLPYATLQKLPADGVVLVASFTRLSGYPGSLGDLPRLKLPLRLSEATHYVQYGTQVRPEDPLGQWEIRGMLRGHVVDVVAYFGAADPSAAALTDAQLQLDRLVVQRVGSTAHEGGGAVPATGTRAGVPTATAATSVVDRTLSCSTGVHGGAHVVYIGSQTGLRTGNVFRTLAQAFVTTSGSSIATSNDYQPQLVAMTAGYPPKPPLKSGGVGYDGKRCVPTNAKVPFATRGLVGGVANQIGEQSACFPAGRVLIHVRVAFTSPPAVRVDRKSRFHQALGRIEVGQIAVRSPAGRPIAYLDVVDRGTARAFTAGGCS